MRIKFLKSCMTVFGMVEKGFVVEVGEEDAKFFIAQGFAEVPAPPPQKPRRATKGATK